MLVRSTGLRKKPRFASVSAADDIPGMEGQLDAAANHCEGALACRDQIIQPAQRIL